MTASTIANLANLGSPVSTRTISWNDQCSRAWGSEFKAPDHKIYQFSGNRNFDSTDMGSTGIYGGGIVDSSYDPNSYVILAGNPSPGRLLQDSGDRILLESA